MTRHRVVVTGLGVKCPAGNDLESYWSTLLAGRSTAARVSAFDTAGLGVDFACEVRGFDPSGYLKVKELRHTDRVAQLAIAAADDAIEDAGGVRADPARCAILLGAGRGGERTSEEQQRVFAERGPTRLSPFLPPMIMPNAPGALVGIRQGWTGPNLCITTACAASGHAIGEAARLVWEGTADVALAGGAEAVITPVTMAAFNRMGAFSSRRTQPELASRPFDADRDGFVLGEGSAFLVLERLELAADRGARIYGEILGYGRNADAYHITAPSPNGTGAAACMALALGDAGLTAADVTHINAHGTSTPNGDAAEAAAIAKVFGPHAVPVTSTKGAIGHLLGGAGAVEAVATLLAIKEGIVPPTANHEQLDPAFEIDVVAGTPRPLPIGPVVSNSFGFGGHNASLVFGPPPT